MKLNLTHRNHSPSPSMTTMLESELQSLKDDLQIDEARVRIERSLTASPPFSISLHLVTPGPDVIVHATDHTLYAAVIKAFNRIRDKIGHRQTKRARNRAKTHVTALPRRLSTQDPKR